MNVKKNKRKRIPKGAIKKGQSTETGNMKNGQSTETGNIEYTTHHYAQTNTNNVNKI